MHTIISQWKHEGEVAVSEPFLKLLIPPFNCPAATRSALALTRANIAFEVSACVEKLTDFMTVS